MQLIFTLLVLTPLVYCATLTNEEQLVIQAMTSEQKRALLDIHALPTVHDVMVATCNFLASTAAKVSCTYACHISILTLQYGSLASPLCDPVCNTIRC